LDRRVLIVDDESQIVDLLREFLRGAGFEVDAAGDAAGALELIRNQIFDAAVIDFNLPDMNGVMLHRQIRQMDPELADRTIFMSGFLQADSNIDYYESYGGGFLAKPFDVRDVVAAIRNVLDLQD
jgi:DNA-binding response OmpR family regulator